MILRPEMSTGSWVGHSQYRVFLHTSFAMKQNPLALWPRFRVTRASPARAPAILDEGEFPALTNPCDMSKQ